MPTSEFHPAISMKKMLLATDFLHASVKAASFTQAFASRFSYRVETVHLFDPTDIAVFEDEERIILPLDERRQLNTDSLERLREQFLCLGIEAQTVSVEGTHPPWNF